MNDNELLKAIDTLFRKRLRSQGIVSNAMKESNTYELAKNMGDLLSTCITEIIDFSTLEEYGLAISDIVDDILSPMLMNSHDLFNNIAYDIRKQLNVKDGIGLNPVKPTINNDKLRKVRLEVNEATDYAAMIDAKVKELTFIFNDDFEKKNADFDYDSGFEITVVRECEPGACDWCRDREGTYSYEEAYKSGAEVWKRHTGCACSITTERHKRISTNSKIRF